MAKDKYTVSTVVDISGKLDYDENECLVVYVETKHGDVTVTKLLPLLDILTASAGMQIVLKLAEVEDKCDE